MYTATPSTPSQSDVNNMVQSHYWAERYLDDTIITCKEDAEGRWEEVEVHRYGEYDPYSQQGRTSLLVKYDPVTHAVGGSTAITNTIAFRCICYSDYSHNGRL